jgi:putative heme-binding domain-containing protein
MWLLQTSVFFLAAGSLLAQHSFTPGDVQDGERLYLANCAVCHGPDGNMVPGTDLAHGKFRRTATDAGLVEIIQKGIPGTAMPPHTLADFRALTIVAFLRSMAATAQSTTVPGDAANGRAIFEGKGNCRSCHRVGANGSRVGPDLTDIGANRRAVEIERSLLDPDAEILPQNRFIHVVPKDGAAITGRLLNQDAFTVQLMDSKERLLSLQKANLKEVSFVDKSPMPSYRDKLTPAELADLVSYLVSLKGISRQ